MTPIRRAAGARALWRSPPPRPSSPTHAHGRGRPIHRLASALGTARTPERASRSVRAGSSLQPSSVVDRSAYQFDTHNSPERTYINPMSSRLFAVLRTLILGSPFLFL